MSDKSTVCNDFLSLLDRFKLGHSLRKLRMEKEKGASALDLLKYLLIFRLFGQNIHQSLHHQFAPFIDGGKNQFYRFLTRPKMDWRRLLYRTAKSFFRIVQGNSADAELEKYFILDDTTIEKSGICMEGISRVFDHVAQKSVLGYKLLLLAITDTKSALPLDFSLHAEAGKKKNFGLSKKQLKDRFTKERAKDDSMKKRADELLKDKPAVAIEMLCRAVKNGHIAKYLLVDKWFFGEDFIKKVRSIRNGAIHIITLLRNKSTGFTVDDKRISAKLLIQKQERIGFKTCRQYKSRYARIKAEYNGIPVQLFIIRYGRSSKYEVMVTTDMKLTFKGAFERYQIRWNIEVLFYECKQHLELGKCQSTDLNAQIADCTLAFIGYTVISLHKRFSAYETFGELFRDIKEGLLELTFIERLLPLIAELLEKIARLLDSTLDDLLERAMADKETRHDLECILRSNQNFKDQPRC
ncbi:MAG: transposase [Candidatus Cryptobacteroides sp.]